MGCSVNTYKFVNASFYKVTVLISQVQRKESLLLLHFSELFNNFANRNSEEHHYGDT
jgi:hypothetical protein